MNPQSRSYSGHPVLEVLTVDDVKSSRVGKTALHDEKLSLKRACSFPAAVYHPSSKPATSSASSKLPFKIQLPSIDLSTLSTAFSRHPKYRETAALSPPQAASADNVLDSPDIEDHPRRTNFPPLFTPPDETPATTYSMSTSDSEQGRQPRQSSAPEAEKTTNPNLASEGIKAAMESGESKGQSKSSNAEDTSAFCEASGGQGAQGNVENGDSDTHWLGATMEATGNRFPIYAALFICHTNLQRSL